MYSPDISRHSPTLYRLGQCYGKPMTAVADRLIAFGLQRLDEVFPESPETSALHVAEEPAPFRADLGQCAPPP